LCTFDYKFVIIAAFFPFFRPFFSPPAALEVPNKNVFSTSDPGCLFVPHNGPAEHAGKQTLARTYPPPPEQAGRRDVGPLGCTWVSPALQNTAGALEVTKWKKDPNLKLKYKQHSALFFACAWKGCL